METEEINLERICIDNFSRSLPHLLLRESSLLATFVGIEHRNKKGLVSEVAVYQISYFERFKDTPTYSGISMIDAQKMILMHHHGLSKTKKDEYLNFRVQYNSIGAPMTKRSEMNEEGSKIYFNNRRCEDYSYDLLFFGNETKK